MAINLDMMNRLVKAMNDLNVAADVVKAKGLTEDANRQEFTIQMAMISGVATSLSLEASALVSDAVTAMKKEGLGMQVLQNAMNDSATKDKFSDLIGSLTTPAPPKTDKSSN